MATMNISLPDALKEWVEQQVATGRYANSSDYVRDLIRKEASREQAFAEMREEARKGTLSGTSPRTVEDIRRAVKAELRAKRRAV